MADQKIYKVVKTIWSNHWQKHFYEGEIVDLSHSTDADIATLLSLGAIVEIPTPAPQAVAKPKKEKVNG